ncbi:MAG: catechol 2,3-dioxygenase, partial [Chloroflexota bacterium]|nr:catechol 2,3-dioxygenase [Chloroflexota bacterium]
MATLPLDLDDVLGELSSEAGFQALAPAGTTMGHVHLQVADVADSEAFYSGVLGFDVMVRAYPGALFVSAGGYHHHIGLNIWNSRGAAPPPPGSVGLRTFEVVVPGPDELQRVLARADAAGIAIESTNSGALMRDPSGNGLILRAA